MIGIFVESNETLGLLYNRYKDIPDITGKFITTVMNADDDDLISDKLDEYKRVTRGIMKTPEPVNPKELKSERKRVITVRKKTETLIERLVTLNNKYKDGSTSDKYPSMKSSIEWVKKVVIDLLNLCDQDLNILSLVDHVYYRKVYESDCSRMMTDYEYGDLMECAYDDTDVDDIFESVFDQLLEETAEGKADIRDVINPISDDKKNDEYFPIFPMSVSYNFGPAYTFMAPIINKVTNGDEYTHSFMSFDPDFRTIMTFGGKGLEYMTVEDYQAFQYSKSVYVGVVWLTKDEMNDVKKTIKEYYENPKDVRFSLINFFSMMFGKIKRKDKSHCCSAFLGYLLNVANKKNLNKDYSMTRPEDITLLPRAFYVGTFKDLEDLNKRRQELKAKVKKIYDDNIDDIREYNNSIPRIMLTDNIKKPKSLKNFFKRMVNGY